MICKNCGKEIKDHDNYCLYCGEKIKEKNGPFIPLPDGEKVRKCESCHNNIPSKSNYCPYCRARKRKDANYPLIQKLLIINTALMLLTIFVFKEMKIFYWLGIFAGGVLSIITIFHSIRGLYRNKAIFLILAIAGIVVSHIYLGLYIILYFFPTLL